MEFALVYLVFEGNSQMCAPAAYIRRGLFSEFYGIVNSDLRSTSDSDVFVIIC